MMESEKISPWIKEFVEAGYKRIWDMIIVGTAEKHKRDEEEKAFLEREKEIMLKEKPDSFKEKKKDGEESWKSTGYDSRFPAPRSSQSDAKPTLPKTQSQSKLKKAVNNKKKAVKSQSSFAKSKPKAKKGDK